MSEILRQDLMNSSGRQKLISFLEKESGNNSLIDTFDRLTELYFKINSVINISAIKNIDDIYIKHYLDSIYPYQYFEGACCDVGCGGGFPCLPLAIVTGLHFSGIDGVGKKLILIEKSISDLGIKNISYEHCRAEDLAKKTIRFDSVCARAVSDINKTISFCAPLTAKNGKLILYKTQNDEQADKNTLKRFNLETLDIIDYVLPNTDIKRRLYIYKKT